MAKSSRIIDALKTNTLYSFHLRAKNSMGVWSDLSDVVTHTTIKDTTVPTVLSSITLLMLSGVFQLKWAKPTTLDLRGGGYKVYVFTANTPASAVLIREVGYTTDSTEIFIGEKSQDASITITAETTYYFWVTTLDASGNESVKVATTPASGSVSAAGTGLDHGVLTGLGDDDHTQYIKHALAIAANDFLVASDAGVFVKKTLAETQAIIGTGAYYTIVPHNTNTVLTNADLGKVHIMDVSGGPRTFTLPDTDALYVGYWLKLVRKGVGNYLRVQAGATDIIWNSSVGGFIDCTDMHNYCSVDLVQIAVGQWTTAAFGIWNSY